jgi:hypothetical protein
MKSELNRKWTKIYFLARSLKYFRNTIYFLLGFQLNFSNSIIIILKELHVLLTSVASKTQVVKSEKMKPKNTRNSDILSLMNKTIE